MRDKGLKEGFKNVFHFLLVAVLVLCPTMVGIGFVALSTQSVGASSSCNIDITATGSEVNISCNVTLWAIGTVRASATENTTPGYEWGAVSNLGSEAVNVTVYGNDMEGGAVTWTLSSNSAGAAQFLMYVNTGAGDNYTIEKEFAGPYLQWATGIAASANQTFGLYFEGPTSGVGNEAMQMTNGGAGATGVVFTASL